MALGLLGGIGVIVLTFVFGVKPGSPPVSAMLSTGVPTWRDGIEEKSA